MEFRVGMKSIPVQKLAAIAILMIELRNIKAEDFDLDLALSNFLFF